MRRLLIIGCGDVGVRLIPLARPRYRVLALTRDRSQCASLRALGATPIFGDLDQPQTLSVLAGIAHDIVHLAPPPAVGDVPQKMGDYFDLVADRHGLQRPPRVARSEAARVIPENLLSFMSESRRLSNHRIKRELRFRLRYPSVHDGIADLRIPGT